MKISCPEEIAYRMGYISRSRFDSLATSLKKSGYGAYLSRLVEADAH
jgi:glucose-1-phosphate thymidylyltransferase